MLKKQVKFGNQITSTMAAIKGKVVDANTGEPVYNAHVVFSDAEGNYYNPPMGAVTDYDGNYELPTLGGEYLTVSHVSYKKVVKKIDLSNYGSGGTYQTTMNFALDGSGFNLTEVIITPETKQWFKKISCMFMQVQQPYC